MLKGAIPYSISELQLKTEQVFQWLQNFDYSAFYSSNDMFDAFPEPHRVKWLACAGAETMLTSRTHKPKELTTLLADEFHFGYLSYDLKNSYEELQSANPAFLSFPDFCFVKPDYVLLLDTNDRLWVKGNSKITEYDLLQQIKATPLDQGIRNSNREIVEMKPDKSDDSYLRDVKTVINHIREGDVYEMNLCRLYSGYAPQFNAADLWSKMQADLPNPFSAFLNTPNWTLCCGSMERYLFREGNKLISQPIKGTIRRGKSPEEDSLLKEELFRDEKERAENLMIVDLVRNDLNRHARVGSVKVDELFGIYSFPAVNQMISTVSCETTTTDFNTLLHDSFPMGSMTGAPKIKAMQLIEEIEGFQRGLYSGALGYYMNQHQFDFNVVIRSVFFDKHSRMAHVPVGSAITYDSIPDKELAECKLKVERLVNSFGGHLKTL